MRILVLPCDGIGPEITKEAVTVLETVSRLLTLNLAFDYEEAGTVSLKKYGTTLRDGVLEKAKAYDGIILGPESHMDHISYGSAGKNVSASFRIGLDLYANIRPARSRPFLDRGVPNMDVVIVREATEGFYPDRNMFAGSGEMMPTADIALSLRKITAHGSERIARRAFELSMKRRKKVTAVHKVSCFTLTDGLFLEQSRKVAKEFSDVNYDEVLVDAMAAHLVRDASKFDVILASNFYGDILSDLASELSGSIGLAGAMMAGDRLCCAQAQHGSAPDIQGKDLANPTSMIMSAAMLMEWIGEHRGEEVFIKASKLIEQSVDKVLANPGQRTADLGGSIGCEAFGRLVADEIKHA